VLRWMSDDGDLDWPGARQLIRLARETKITGKTANH
jgi:hypothetical protein